MSSNISNVLVLLCTKSIANDNVLTKKLTATCYNVTFCSWLVKLPNLFLPGQRTHEGTFCLANALGILPKVPFANLIMTAISPYITQGFPGARCSRLV